MDWLTPELLSAISTALAALAAVLAWAAKLWWSKEFAGAKDETIKAKDAQIATLEREIKSLNDSKNDQIQAKNEQIATLEREVKMLNELTPMKIREYFLSVKEQLEEYNESLKEKLQNANKLVEDREIEIQQLIVQGKVASEEIKRLTDERNRIQQQVVRWTSEYKNVERYGSFIGDVVVQTLPFNDIDAALYIAEAKGSGPFDNDDVWRRLVKALKRYRFTDDSQDQPDTDEADSTSE